VENLEKREMKINSSSNSTHDFLCAQHRASVPGHAKNAVHESDYRSVVDATFMGTGNEQTNPLLQRYKEQDD
jgi:hypothetical protein